MRKPLEICLGKFKEIFKNLKNILRAVKPETWMVIVMIFQGIVMFYQARVMLGQEKVMKQQKEVTEKQTKIMSYTAIKRVPELELKPTEHGILLMLKSHSDVPLYVRPQFVLIPPKKNTYEDREEYEKYITALALLVKSLQQGYSLFSNLLGNVFLLDPKEEKEIPFLSDFFFRSLCKKPTNMLCKYLKTHRELRLLIITRLCFRPIYDRREEATNSVAYLLTIKDKNKPFPYIEIQRLNSMQLLEIDEQYHLAKPVRLHNCTDK